MNNNMLKASLDIFYNFLLWMMLLLDNSWNSAIIICIYFSYLQKQKDYLTFLSDN